MTQERDTTALAPCPFCGGEPEIINYSVHCNNPFCEAQPYTAGQTVAEAIAAWNRRTEPTGTAGGWRKIASAPFTTDPATGCKWLRECLLLVPVDAVAIQTMVVQGVLSAGVWLARCVNDPNSWEAIVPEPTHWQPLPTPPSHDPLHTAGAAGLVGDPDVKGEVRNG